MASGVSTLRRPEIKLDSRLTPQQPEARPSNPRTSHRCPVSGAGGKLIFCNELEQPPSCIIVDGQPSRRCSSNIHTPAKTCVLYWTDAFRRDGGLGPWLASHPGAAIRPVCSRVLRELMQSRILSKTLRRTRSAHQPPTRWSLISSQRRDRHQGPGVACHAHASYRTLQGLLQPPVLQVSNSHPKRNKRGTS